MRIIQWRQPGKKKTYDCQIRVIDEKKLISWIDCTCEDFIHRRIKSAGDFADKKYYSEPCKHLKPEIDALIRMGYELKQPKPMEGTDHPTKQLLNALIQRSGGLCEANCGQKAKHIHRKIRGSNGGKYNESNCVYLCPECHRKIHSNEFAGSKSR